MLILDLSRVRFDRKMDVDVMSDVLDCGLEAALLHKYKEGNRQW